MIDSFRCRIFFRLAMWLVIVIGSAATHGGNDEAAFSQGLLWKIERAGAAPSYLFGTVHTDDARVLALPQPVQTAFDAAQVFAAELIDDEGAGRKFRAALVTREPRLPRLLDEENFRRVDALLGKHGIARAARPHLKPWAAMLTLLQPTQVGDRILDRVLIGDAAPQRKAIRALETVDEQIAIFDDMQQQTQLALLRAVAAGYGNVQSAYSPLIEAYLAGDLQRMFVLNGESFAAGSAIDEHNAIFLDRVLYQRNRRFAERLIPLIDKGGAFAAFGALHLYGEQGVPAILQARGYSVWRVF